MSRVVTCPDCDQSLRLPDHALGKTVMCPSCRTQFEVDQDGQTSTRESSRPREDSRGSSRLRRELEETPRPRRRFEEDEDDDYEAEEEEQERRIRRRGRSGATAWAPVQRGLTMIIAAIFVLLGGAVLAVCGGMLTGGLAAAAAQRRGGPPNAALMPFFAVIMVFAGVVYLTAIGLTVAGYFSCTGAPHGRSRKLAQTSAFLLVGGLFCYIVAIVGLLVTGPGFNRPNPPVVGMVIFMTLYALGGLMLFTQSITFQFFLRSVALAVREDGLATSIMAMIITGGISILLLIMVGVFMAITEAGNRGREPSPIAALGGCFISVLWLAWGIWYLVTLFQVRSAVSR